MLQWNKAQWEAFGQHILTAVSSVLATLVLVDVIPAAKAGELMAHTTNIVMALIGLAAIIGPVIAAKGAVYTASPSAQADGAAKALNEGTLTNGKKEALIKAVAEQPEVRKVVVKDPTLAATIPSDKVTSA